MVWNKTLRIKTLLMLLFVIVFYSCSRVKYNYIVNNIEFNKIEDTIFLDGIYITIYQDSNIVFVNRIKNKSIHGIVKMYNYETNTSITGKYKNGKKTGVWCYYDKTGVIQKKEYYSDGEIYQTVIFKEGKRIKGIIGIPPF